MGLTYMTSSLLRPRKKIAYRNAQQAKSKCTIHTQRERRKRLGLLGKDPEHLEEAKTTKRSRFQDSQWSKTERLSETWGQRGRRQCYRDRVQVPWDRFHVVEDRNKGLKRSSGFQEVYSNFHQQDITDYTVHIGFIRTTNMPDIKMQNPQLLERETLCHWHCNVCRVERGYPYPAVLMHVQSKGYNIEESKVHLSCLCFQCLSRIYHTEMNQTVEVLDNVR